MADPTLRNADGLLPDKKGIPRYKFRIQQVGVEIEGAWRARKVAGPPPPPPPALQPIAWTNELLQAVKDRARRTWNDGNRRFTAVLNGVLYEFDVETVLNAVGAPAPRPPRPEPVPTPPLFTDGTQVKGDPSVKFPTVTGLQAIGEVVSQPMIRPALWIWVRDHYPDVVNRTCGIHVHMSFRHELDYQRLITPAYHDHILLGLHAWGLATKLPKDHVFWPRIRGCNLFAQDVFHGDYQARYGDRNFEGGRYHDNRYGIVNYCWAKHKTVEVRVLPTFSDRKMAIRAIRRVLNLTEEFLDRVRQEKEPEHHAVVPMPTRMEPVATRPPTVSVLRLGTDGLVLPAKNGPAHYTKLFTLTGDVQGFVHDVVPHGAANNNVPF